MTSAIETSPGSVLKGISAVICGVFIFTMVDATAKWMSGIGFHPTQIVMMRYWFGIIPVIVALWFARGVSLRTGRPWEHLLRGVLMCGALLQFFWGLKYVPLAEAMAVGFTAPLFITALSVPVLKERVGAHRWAAVAIGFVGMLVILRPGYGTFRPEVLLIVSSAFTFALGVVLTRRLTTTETNSAIFAYTTLVSVVFMSPVGLAVWKAPGGEELAMFAMIGLFGGLAHFLLIVAYRHAPAAVNSPFEYTGLIWGSVLGWAIWRETPDVWVWVGAGVIAVSGMYITYRETIRGRYPAVETETVPH